MKSSQTLTFMIILDTTTQRISGNMFRMQGCQGLSLTVEFTTTLEICRIDENLTFRIILHHYILKTLHTRIILDHRIYYYIAGLPSSERWGVRGQYFLYTL